MDLKINNISFKGRNEIICGLSKAAKNTYSYSMYSQPRLLRLGDNKNLLKYQTAAETYLDMVTADSEFLNVVKDLTEDELFITKNYLKPQKNGVKPLEYFKTILYKVIEERRNDVIKANAGRTLLEKLA